jgi:3-isopropylmalate/(R)-2-methylmalate dehydratase small subunit
MTPFVSLDAVALPIAQPNFDTDQIFPARFLSRDRELGLAECLFRDLRFTAEGTERPEFPLNKPEFRTAEIVVGEKNFACGSSRENAVWALADYGFRAAIAPSFGDIFRTNSIKNGVLPVVLPAPVVAGLLAMLEAEPGSRIAIDLASQTVTLPDGTSHGFDIDPFAKHCLLNGVDELAFTLGQLDQIQAFENRYGRENI